jgi:hypothetical protein
MRKQYAVDTQIRSPNLLPVPCALLNLDARPPFVMMWDNVRMKGVVPLYRRFKSHLSAERHKLAKLQLLCRLEDYLTKEFAVFILDKSEGTVLPIMNIGKRIDERRIDIAPAEGDLSPAVNKQSAKQCRPTIRGFIEVKYVRYRHRWDFSDAQDETGMTFHSLQHQLGQMDKGKLYAGYQVKLRSSKREIYGLVFASYCCRDEEYLRGIENTKQAFLERIIRSAKKHDFTTSNMKTPKLSAVYSDVLIHLLGARFRVSLYAGLWRLKEGHKPLEGIRQGLNDVAHGRTRPAREAFEQIRRKHDIPRRTGLSRSSRS